MSALPPPALLGLHPNGHLPADGWKQGYCYCCSLSETYWGHISCQEYRFHGDALLQKRLRPSLWRRLLQMFAIVCTAVLMVGCAGKQTKVKSSALCAVPGTQAELVKPCRLKADGTGFAEDCKLTAHIERTEICPR